MLTAVDLVYRIGSTTGLVMLSATVAFFLLPYGVAEALPDLACFFYSCGR